jgi:hypothetical protein
MTGKQIQSIPAPLRPKGGSIKWFSGFGRGFAYLQGNDGNIKNFAIHGMEVGVYPRAQ